MREMVECQVREDGELRLGCVHDAVIVSFEFKNDRCSIEVVNEDGRTELEVGGIHDMLLSSFSRRPIVSFMMLWKVGEAPITKDGEPFGFSHLGNQRSGPAGVEFHRTRLAQLYPDLLVLQILCSDGGPMTFICRSVRALVHENG